MQQLGFLAKAVAVPGSRTCDRLSLDETQLLQLSQLRKRSALQFKHTQMQTCVRARVCVCIFPTQPHAHSILHFTAAERQTKISLIQKLRSD